jgi:hypothetical protein
MNGAGNGCRTALLVAMSATIGAVLGAPAAGFAASIAHKIDGSQIKHNSVTGTQIKESTLSAVPTAKTVKKLPALQWQPVTLINGWTSAHGVDVGRDPAVALSSEGIVYMRGSIAAASPSDDIVFVMPTAMRPTTGAVLVPVDESFANTGRLEVTPEGNVTVADDPEHDGTAKEYVSLEGISYPLG